MSFELPNYPPDPRPLTVRETLDRLIGDALAVWTFVMQSWEEYRPVPPWVAAKLAEVRRGIDMSLSLLDGESPARSKRSRKGSHE